MQKNPATLDLNPEATSEALKALLAVAPTQEVEDWMIAALCVLDPDAAGDPAMGNQQARLRAIESCGRRRWQALCPWSRRWPPRRPWKRLQQPRTP
jgi:hypothetical protein